MSSNPDGTVTCTVVAIASAKRALSTPMSFRAPNDCQLIRDRIKTTEDGIREADTSLKNLRNEFKSCGVER